MSHLALLLAVGHLRLFLLKIDVRAWALSPKLAQAGPRKPSRAQAVTTL